MIRKVVYARIISCFRAWNYTPLVLSRLAINQKVSGSNLDSLFSIDAVLNLI